MKIRLHLSILIIVLVLSNNALVSQYFSNTDYKKALWMTTRYYGGQRSGSGNWLVYNYLPAGVPTKYKGQCFIDDNDAGYDLSGGWHDCGDHVKFGQTQFYSAYMLLKGFVEFPTGYDDYYNQTYDGYTKSGKWAWEDNTHKPNAIPDVLDEVAHATDYFIKCIPNPSTFYWQVGDGGPDHTTWVTAVYMQTLTQANGGQQRKIFKNPQDASMPSFCAATLAIMSRVYAKYDSAYAAKCLVHAKYAYAYAKAHPGTVGSPGFYGANGNWKDDYATMCAELYWATNDLAYKTEALSFSIGNNKDINGGGYGLDYSNNGDLAIYNLTLLGKTGAQSLLNSIALGYIGNVQGDGQFAGGNTSWGPLRYNANTAFIVALWQKQFGTAGSPHKYIYDNIDYILGKNSSNLSFVVGFGAKSAKFPHHRTVYLRDDDPSDADKLLMTIPLKNKQFGSMVGGSRSPGSYNDSPINYQQTEGGIDYNAGLVNVLAYINSVLAPVDTSKFHASNAVNELRTLARADLFPNPSSTSFTLQSSTPTHVQVIDQLGSLQQEFDLNGTMVFGQELNAGMYHILFRNDNNSILYTKNMIKE